MKVFLSGVFLIVIAAAASFAHAQSESSVGGPSRGASPKQDPRKAFRLGVCVGQELAAAGIDVAALDPSSSTEELRTSFKTAMTTCHSQLDATSAGTSESTNGAPTEPGAEAMVDPSTAQP